MTTNRRVALEHGHVWEITTEHGTRHLVDLRDPEGPVRRLRIPGEGRPKHSHDNAWQGRVGIVHHRAMEEENDWERGHEVVIGEPCEFPGPGFGDYHVTMNVLTVRELDDGEIPSLGTVAYEPVAASVETDE